MSKANFNKNLLFLFFISTGFHTLFNPGGVLPFSLIFGLLITFNLFFFTNYTINTTIPKFSFLDILLFSFLLNSIVSYLLSNSIRNINHLYSHFTVILIFYYALRLFISINRHFLSNYMILNSLYYAFLLISFSVIIDQTFLAIGINIADYIPMETSNLLVGVGIFTRARGFFVEPTDLALGINTFAPIVLCFLIMTKKLNKFYIVLMLYLLILILTRSTAGFVEIFAGIFICLIDIFFNFLFKKNFSFKFSKKGLNQIILLIIVLTCIFFILIEPLSTAFNEAYQKLNFTKESSGDVRAVYWDETLNSFLNSKNIFTGFGTGYTSFNQKTFNWYLTVLIENGLIGFSILTLLFILLFKKIISLKTNLKYGFYIAAISAILHLTTQTGFYYPFLWLIIVLAQINWDQQQLYKV